MSDSVNKRSVWVGIFILAGLLFLAAGILTIGNLHSTFQKKMTISTVFKDVNGLMEGNNIWFSGVKIGTVKKIDFTGSSDVKVVMNINEESQQYIRKDAKVKVSTDGLIGNKILVIYGGSSTSPEVEEGDVLGNEKILSMDDMMATLQQNNQNILTITSKLANGEGTLGKLMSSDSVYNSIAAATVSLQMASARAQVLMASLSEFSSNLNKKGTLANDLVTDTTVFASIRSSVTELQKIADTASVVVNSLKTASQDPNSPFGVLMKDDKAGAQLKTSIDNLESISQKLNTDVTAMQSSSIIRRWVRKDAKRNPK